jgi:hypothetical protein
VGKFEATLVDGLFFNLLPTLDNLRNFFLTTTTEVLSFFQQCEKRFSCLESPSEKSSPALQLAALTEQFELSS